MIYSLYRSQFLTVAYKGSIFMSKARQNIGKKETFRM